jgi:hypothetical protein
VTLLTSNSPSRAQCLPGATAEEILAAWGQQRARLARPSPRLFVSFFGQDAEGNDVATRARRFADTLGDPRVCVVAQGVLVDPLADRSRRRGNEARA